MKTFTTWGICTVLLCLTASSVSADLASGLDGYWTFDEITGGILMDYSGNGHDGTLVNYPNGQGNWTTGKLGGALQFGGPSSGQSVRVPNFAMPTNSMTLTAWVRASSLPRWATVAANWNGGWGAFNYATFGATPNLSLYVADANVQGGINIDHGTSSTSLSLNQWHFVAFVANSQNNTVTFMQDGFVTGSFRYFGKLLASSSTLNIGDDPSDTNAGQGNWDGSIDDLAIWNRALNSQELADIYHAGLAGQSLLTLLLPTVTCPDAHNVECGSPATVTVTVTDPVGEGLTVFWAVDGVLIQTNLVPAGIPASGTDVSFASELPLGTNVLEVTVVDSLANTATCSTIVTVVDTTAPEIIGATASPDSLWPPNHKMVKVTLSASVADNCEVAGWRIIDVQSDQPVQGRGRGHTTPDWRILSDDTVELRAEWSAATPRTYTITIQAEDASGNLSEPDTVNVRVQDTRGYHQTIFPPRRIHQSE